MSNQKHIPYHKQLILPTNKELREEAHMLENKMLQLLDNCAKNQEKSLENLHEHLRIAMMLELSTIPPYLCALYSIMQGDSSSPNYKEEYGDNAEVAYIIRSVMMEEMLHLTLAGNVLNAVGGAMKINHSKYVPEYPTILPDSSGKFKVSLSKFDKDAIRTFMRIEQPTPANTPPRFDGYSTIGQFYSAILLLMEELEAIYQLEGKTIFTGNEDWQIDKNFYYGGGGEVIKVTNLEEAKMAIDVILEQGEGTEDTIYDDDHDDFGQIQELAHFFKYNEIYEEQRYASCQTDPKEPPQGEKMHIKYDKVYNMLINPKTEDFVSDDLKLLSYKFNLKYRQLLDKLQAAFTGNQNEFIGAVGVMYELRYGAIELMRNPIPGAKVNAGPTFEFLDDDEIRALQEKLNEMLA